MQIVTQNKNKLAPPRYSVNLYQIPRNSYKYIPIYIEIDETREHERLIYLTNI
jgi:hypothetical protein